jgi:hypothetical protein
MLVRDQYLPVANPYQWPILVGIDIQEVTFEEQQVCLHQYDQRPSRN